MTKLFDTSCLIPALLEKHPHHERVFPVFDDALGGNVELALSAHGLAEVYASLTALQVAPLASIGSIYTAMQENILSVATIVPLDASDYEIVIARMTNLGLISGAIYDSLHVRAAEKIEADELLTCNGRDFRRMPPQPPTKLVVL